jgi:hypothetical protein
VIAVKKHLHGNKERSRHIIPSIAMAFSRKKAYRLHAFFSFGNANDFFHNRGSSLFD